MFSSPFGPSPAKDDLNIIDIKDSEVIFVSDMFASQYAGGAELTTEALYKKSKFKTFKLNSQYIN